MRWRWEGNREWREWERGESPWTRLSRHHRTFSLISGSGWARREESVSMSGVQNVYTSGWSSLVILMIRLVHCLSSIVLDRQSVYIFY